MVIRSPEDDADKEGNNDKTDKEYLFPPANSYHLPAMAWSNTEVGEVGAPSIAPLKKWSLKLIVP